MIRPFVTMAEDQREKAFVYTCASGHSWTIPFDQYDQVRYDQAGQYLPNNCPTCETVSDESE